MSNISYFALSIDNTMLQCSFAGVKSAVVVDTVLS